MISSETNLLLLSDYFQTLLKEELSLVSFGNFLEILQILSKSYLETKYFEG